jgi:PAS domain S-box-containing protein
MAETLGKAAALSDRAILIGNRAGIVAWANPAWTRITGFPLSETVSKPITDFLGKAAIEIELVDFVGQNFLDGQFSSIEFPFETFDNRSIWVHLDVQPVRNTAGEISDFVATATDISERRRLDSIDQAATADVGRSETKPEARHLNFTEKETRVSLSAETEIVCERIVRLAGSRTHFDIDLNFGIPSTQFDRLLLGEIIRLLMRAATLEADESWGFVTVMTGQTEVGRSHISEAHPVPVRDGRLAKGPFLYLEIHDTSPTLSSTALDAIREGKQSADPRTHCLSTAAALVKALGGSLLVDSTPGCGTQSLLLLPIS